MFVPADAEGVAFISGSATVIAALILGGIAAWTADRRLAKEIAGSAVRQQLELAAAAEGQRRELNSEADRQLAALRHDRELADLEDLRKLLDQAAVALSDADEARADLEVRFVEHGCKTGLRAPETLDLVKEVGKGLFTLRERLRVRLGNQDAIAQGFDESTMALLRSWQAVSTLTEDSDATELKEARNSIREEAKMFRKGWDAFGKASVARAGTIGKGLGVAIGSALAT